MAPRSPFMTAGVLLAALCALVLSAQSAKALNATAPGSTTSLLSVVDYSPDHVSYSGDTVTIKIDPASGSRVHSVGRYAYGVFSADIKCPSGDTKGLVPTFYTSSSEGSDDKDELDFEFLGKNSSIVQTNYWVNGVGQHEAVHELGFDCSTAFHTYTIEWTEVSTRWLIDGRLVRTLVNTGNSSAYPTKPAYAYASIWDNGNAGKDWNGLATYANSPYFYQLANVRVTSPGTATGPSPSSPARGLSPGPARGPAPTSSPLGSPTSKPPARKLLR